MKQKCNLIVPLGLKKDLKLEITIPLSKLKIKNTVRGKLSINTTLPELTFIPWYHTVDRII